MRRSGRRAVVALAVTLGFASGPSLVAQEVSTWFDRSPDAAAYAAVKQDLLVLAARSISGMHSDRPLAERLAEGARKHVAPDRLLAALGTETDRLLSAAAEIDKRRLLPTDPRSAGTMMAQVGIALRAGLEPQDIGAAFDGAAARLGASPAARERALAVISAMTGLSLDAKQRYALIAALAASQLPTVRFRGVRGALAELLARQLTPEQATTSLIESFSAQAPVSVEPRREREGASTPKPSAGGSSSHEGEGGGNGGGDD